MLAAFQDHPAVFVLAITLLGLAVGSFLNVVVHRLPVMLKRAWATECREWLNAQDNQPEQDAVGEPYNLVTPRSQCPACGRRITAFENIPLLSYLALRGRCAACHTRISPRYPLVEGLTALLSFTVAWRYGYAWATLGALAFTWALIALSAIDLQTTLLPDSITIPWLWLGLLANTGGVFTNLHSSLLGAVFGYLVLWCIYHLFRLVTGKEGMGYGDFKLLAMIGAWTGWQALPLVILLSSAVGACVGIILMVMRGRDRNVPIPFGPYLAVAGWIALLWGDRISAWYLQQML
jgi:leader peptidase (prepilin peptidase) / N-methyltransferase